MPECTDCEMSMSATVLVTSVDDATSNVRRVNIEHCPRCGEEVA